MFDRLLQFDSFHSHVSAAGFADDANLGSHADNSENVTTAGMLFLEFDSIVWLKLYNGWHVRFHLPFFSRAALLQ